MSPARWEEMTFSDKIIYRQLCDEDDRFASYNDKLRMRQLVSDRLGDMALPTMLRVTSTAEEMADLVGPFALKANHGSGWVILVKEARVLTDEELATAASWLRTNYGESRREFGYEHARPMLLAEELLGNPPPPDFKVFCFAGEPEVLLVCLDRMSELRRTFVTLDWKVIGGMLVPPPAEVPDPPEHLAAMLDAARMLSDGTDFLRVDFYDLADRSVVGELTPYPLAGRQRFSPPSLDAQLGRLWPLPADLRAP
jgi:hypothetical protein